MRKHPIYYKGNTYEVKWDLDDCYDFFEKVILVYHVNKVKFLGITFNNYKYLCSLLEEEVNEQLQAMGVDKNSEDIHIHQAEFAVRKAAKHVKVANLDKIRKEKLRSWSGVIKDTTEE